jgi:hypothetical protein
LGKNLHSKETDFWFCTVVSYDLMPVLQEILQEEKAQILAVNLFS